MMQNNEPFAVVTLRLHSAADLYKLTDALRAYGFELDGPGKPLVQQAVATPQAAPVQNAQTQGGAGLLNSGLGGLGDVGQHDIFAEMNGAAPAEPEVTLAELRAKQQELLQSGKITAQQIGAICQQLGIPMDRALDAGSRRKLLDHLSQIK